MSDAVAVLVHGAGHTSAVWDSTCQWLRHRSVAVDIPGRSDRWADIGTVTVAQAAESIADDLVDLNDHELVLVGHSIGGVLLPSISARLGHRVRQLVFVAGLSAAEDELPVEVFMPGGTERLQAMLEDLRGEHRGLCFEALPPKMASAIDSLNFTCQPMRWAEIPKDVPRTFVRCLRDPIQSREVQARLAERCGASHVIDIDTGHTPAIDAPGLLAAVLDDIIDRGTAQP